LPHTQACLRAIAAHTSQPLAITIWDNASTDGTTAWLRSLAWPHLTVHCSPTNRGVAGGRNELLRRVLPRLCADGVLVFLDNDIEVRPGWTAPFLRLFAARPQCGLASKIGWSHVGTPHRAHPVPAPPAPAPA